MAKILVEAIKLDTGEVGFLPLTQEEVAAGWGNPTIARSGGYKLTGRYRDPISFEIKSIDQPISLRRPSRSHRLGFSPRAAYLRA